MYSACRFGNENNTICRIWKKSLKRIRDLVFGDRHHSTGLDLSKRVSISHEPLGANRRSRWCIALGALRVVGADHLGLVFLEPPFVRKSGLRDSVRRVSRGVVG